MLCNGNSLVRRAHPPQSRSVEFAIAGGWLRLSAEDLDRARAVNVNRLLQDWTCRRKFPRYHGRRTGHSAE